MARRRELAGVANDLIHSFNSRNNDVEGYWGLGRLKRFSVENNHHELLLQLLAGATQSKINLFKRLSQHYTARLLTLLVSHKLPQNWVVQATIKVQFIGEIPGPFEARYPCSSGEFYRCYCEITDDRGRVYKSDAYGFCRPHSPEKEFRRM